MANQEPNASVNAGEENTNSPANLPLSSEDQFRLLNKRLDRLSQDFAKIAKPSPVRAMDLVQIIVIVMGFVVAIVTGYGIDTRVSDLRSDLAAIELRLSAAIKDSEVRLTAKSDKAADQATMIDERLSRIEGAKAVQGK